MGNRGKIIHIPERICIQKPTLDYFYPNINLKNDPSGLVDGVNVMFMELLTTKKYPQKLWRIGVWGGDDFGLELDLPDRDDCYRIFQDISIWETVNIEDLEKLGFLRV